MDSPLGSLTGIKGSGTTKDKADKSSEKPQDTGDAPTIETTKAERFAEQEQER